MAPSRAGPLASRFASCGRKSIIRSSNCSRPGHLPTSPSEKRSARSRITFKEREAIIVPVQRFTEDQIRRYHRHIIMDKVGPIGQRKLLNARVLLLGAGGLGSPAALYLAAAGVGTLGIVDFDTVDLSNLQRQILHRADTVGMLKVDSAAKTIAGIDPDVNVVKLPVALRSDNVFDIIKDFDIIVDGTDNFQTRYLINDASVMTNKTVIHGSIFQFDGQVTMFKPHDGPCYRCLFPSPPPPGAVPNCAEAGVF